MTKVAELQQAIMNLPRSEYAKIIEWLHEFEEEEWDRHIGADSEAGKLDALVAEALEAKAKGALKCLRPK